jgi:epoxide hydrolase
MSQQQPAGPPSDRAIEPFRLEIQQDELDDLQRRLASTRWPADSPEPGWSRGVPLDYLRQLATYWASGFDWRREEAALNEVPQFSTEIDGQRIHFLHLRSPEENALPLLLLHSWPGSPVEFARLLGPLSDPAAHGGQGADAFHLIVPSIPGFGLSAPVNEPGWSSGRIARACVELMHRLGYRRYAVHGGDVGAGIAAGLSAADPDGVLALHVTTDPPTAVTFASWSGDPTQNPALSPDQRERVAELKQTSSEDEGYLRLQSTRPQTIAYALTDSPVGQLAWIIEKFKAWTDSRKELPEDAVDKDQLLTNISLYWFTRSGAASAHALYESMNAQEWSEPGPALTGFAVFGAEPFVRLLLDPESKVEHWSEFVQGGHFPAMEQPELLIGDLRRFFARYR